MEPILDAKNYSHDLNWWGAGVMIFLVLLFLFDVFLYGFPPPLMVTFGFWSFFIIGFIFLKYFGALFQRSIKVYSEGIELQSRFAFSPKFVPFSEISLISVCQYFNFGGDGFESTFEIKTCSGKTVSSPENFRNSSPNGFFEFVEKLKPVLISKDFLIKEETVKYGGLLVSDETARRTGQKPYYSKIVFERIN
ncbi:MAG: hypothetical protein Q7S92_05405 [Candidatus Diapherotrites archaeon]|nr:hypothetical protein [Candidatus Diapherotrites archaeon]